MINMEELKIGDILKLNIEITIQNKHKTKYYTKEGLKDFLNEMVKYYFNGDITILLKYISGEADIKDTILPSQNPLF